MIEDGRVSGGGERITGVTGVNHRGYSLVG